MKLPILAYGHSILREKCKEIEGDFHNLTNLIRDMWETMENASGCGLAAPQIGQAIRLFIVDSQTTYQHLGNADRKYYFDAGDTGIKETFINPRIISSAGSYWEDEEGCLSIPGLARIVERPWAVTIEYEDLKREKQVKSFSGTTARMIQHEYDHIEGTLYLDHLNQLTRRLLEARLKKIKKGQIKVRYPMKFI